jgi:hypothetical protein
MILKGKQFSFPGTAAEAFQVKPIASTEDMNFMSSDIFIVEGQEKIKEKELYRTCQLLYVRGFFDSLQGNQFFLKGALKDIPIPDTWDILSELKGMTIEQVVDTIVKFYHDYPQHRDYSPATVVVYVLPRIRKGLSPFPEKE